jgi:hypothetical protein
MSDQAEIEEEQHNRDGQQRHRIGGGKPPVDRRARGVVEYLGCVDPHACARAHQEWHFEGLDRGHEQEEQRGADRRQRERQRDAPQRAPVAGAGHCRRLFEPRVHGLEGGREQEIDQRHHLERLHPHHAPEAVDVDDVAHAGRLQHQLIEQADVRACDQDP